MSDAVELRTLRHEVAAQEYTGPESLTGAFEIRQRMAATVDLARRAKVDARDHLWNAREAERALGRLILAAREAGDLRSKGGDPSAYVNVPDLGDLGISRMLAAHAISLAGLPDGVWEQIHEADVEPTQGAVGKLARRYRDAEQEIRDGVERERAEQRRAKDRAKAIKQELVELAERLRVAQERIPDVPPLTEEDVDTSAADMVVPAAAVEEPVDTADHVAAERWLTKFRELRALAKALDEPPPALPVDEFADMTVLSARDLVQRITAAAAVWIRDINHAYKERIGQ